MKVTLSQLHKPANSKTAHETELHELPGWRVDRSLPGVLEDCTLIVPTYRRTFEVLRLLAALVTTIDPPGEVIIADGAQELQCEDAVRRWMGERSLPFDLIYVRAPKGLTIQRNVGIDISTGDYIFFLDDDCVPEAGYFNAMRSCFESDRDHSIGAVTGWITNGMCGDLPLRWRIRLNLGLVPRREPGMYCECGTSIPRKLRAPFPGVRDVDVLSGGVSAFRRCVFDNERFSEFFRGYAQGEDLEMSLRLRRKWRIVWCGDARTAHLDAETGRPGSLAKGKMEIVNRHFIWKRYSAHAPWIDRLRFWCDSLFLTSLDLAEWGKRPWRPERLVHAFGLAVGVLQCLIKPPSHIEPRAVRRYALSRD